VNTVEGNGSSDCSMGRTFQSLSQKYCLVTEENVRVKVIKGTYKGAEVDFKRVEGKYAYCNLTEGRYVRQKASCHCCSSEEVYKEPGSMIIVLASSLETTSEALMLEREIRKLQIKLNSIKTAQMVKSMGRPNKLAQKKILEALDV